MKPGMISATQVEHFRSDGFVILEGLFDRAEIDLLRDEARQLREDAPSVARRRDGQGNVVRLALENELSDDVASAFVRSPRIVRPMEQLLNGEVYHYHHKMILKDPHVGGAWEWHQDYGYWYGFGCLFPELASCMVAVDRARPENGCLEVVRGSHHMGRVDHVAIGDQTGADPERVAAALERMEVVPCPLDPGSAIFFHCNTLHRSGPNRSSEPRWAFIACYNTARNNPYRESRHARYSRLEVGPDRRITPPGRP